MSFLNKIKADLDRKIAKEKEIEKKVDTSRKKSAWRGVLDGEVLISETFFKFLPLIIVFVFISIFYINNRFAYEAKVKNNNELKKTQIHLQTTELVKMSKLNEVSTRSAVIHKLKEMDSRVAEPNVAPIVISE